LEQWVVVVVDDDDDDCGGGGGGSGGQHLGLSPNNPNASGPYR
jgi:hypothetical protein